MQSPATIRVGEMIREMRQRRKLDLVKLARLSGVSTATISRIERGKQPGITFAMADRILSAMDLRLHVDTVPLWADLDQAIDEASRLPLTERIAAWPFEFTPFVSRLDGIPFLLDGLAAAAVQGAPVLVDEIEIAVPRDDESLDRLTFVLTDIMARRGPGMQSLDPREPGADYYACIAGRFRIRLIEEYRPELWVDIDPLPEEIGGLPSVYNRSAPALTRARLAVVPLTEIQARDSHAQRVIARIAARRLAAG